MSQTRRTEANPSGIASYDIRKYAELPEWHALEKALSDVANAARRAGIDGGQDALAEAVEHLARGVPYGDCCNTCMRQYHDYRDIYTPFIADVRDGNSLLGSYRCKRGHVWTCGYALDAPWTLG